MSAIIIHVGGGEQVTYDTNDLTATAKDVVINYTYIGADTDPDVGMECSTGAMPTADSLEQTISSTYYIPKGYLQNSSAIRCADLVTFLTEEQKGTAEAGLIKKDKLAYINGKLVSGTLDSLIW